ncbi:MAG: LptF/LptG family permease [Thermodesulfovibrionia bacterium]|nr:LptF/LptG family permease [Thermodesulfovibrionia bacterium]
MLIHRSIFKELLVNFLIVISFLSFVLFMEKFVRITKLILGKGVELMDFIKVFLFLQPSILLLSLPMAILITVFLTYGRMSSDNEVIILKGSGMSFWSVSKPAVMFSIAGFLILLSISFYLLPKSIHSFKKTLYETIAKKASMIIEEETFSKVSRGTVLFVKEMLPDDRFKGIFVYSEGDTEEPLVIVAEEGAISSDAEEGIINLSMRNGVIHTFGENNSSEASFSEYDFVLTSFAEKPRELKPNERGIIELWKGRSSILWMVEFNRRLTIPFACLIFGFLGPSLSTRIGKTGRLGGFSFSLSILIAYYVVMILCEGLVKAQRLPPFLGGWIPNIMFGTVAIVFFYIAYRDKPIFKKKLKVTG